MAARARARSSHIGAGHGDGGGCSGGGANARDGRLDGDVAETRLNVFLRISGRFHGFFDGSSRFWSFWKAMGGSPTASGQIKSVSDAFGCFWTVEGERWGCQVEA